MAEHAVPSGSAAPSAVPGAEQQEPASTAATEQAAPAGGAPAAPASHGTTPAVALPSVSSGQLYTLLVC